MISFETLKKILPDAINETHLSLPLKHRGKVRDTYLLEDGNLLLVTTDRLSAFDRVLGLVPLKGQVLNQLSAWWFERTKDIIENHVIKLPDANSLIAKNVEALPIEVIVRGFITGVTSTALWRRYELGEREIYGYHFPEGLKKNQVLPEPIITPTTKGGPTEHDERLTCAEVTEKNILDQKTWDFIQEKAIQLFKRGQELAEQGGLLLVDTKYEFGRTKTGDIILIDEIHTPDSSRFWKKENYEERFQQGLEPENLDKEWLRLTYVKHGYRGEGEPPVLPPEIWCEAAQKYIEVYERLTHTELVVSSAH